MPEKHFDDGLAFLVNTLRDASRSGRNDSYDVYIPDIAREFMRAGAPRVNLSERPDYRREHENMKLHALPLYDAAWELCRRGILRPSPVCPAGQANSSFTGEGYFLTNLGAHGLRELLSS